MQTRWTEAVLTTSADHAVCRALIRQGSKSFFAASLLLPRNVREPALALYAFCREADDLVDQPCAESDPLEQLRARLARVYEARPLPIAVDRAFAEVVVRYAIPRVLPEALLEGFHWDAQGRRYEDARELNAYAARVAGSVGAMMACLMNARESHTVARACELGVAMQLTNIARDVGEDARNGRLYLPLAWLREAGVDPERWLRNPVLTSQLAVVIGRLLDAADVLYERASRGIARLPRECRRGIWAARLLYAEIGSELRRNGFDSVARRTVVPLARKTTLLARALAAADAVDSGEDTSPLAEARFLIEAVASEPCGKVAHGAPLTHIDNKIAWLVELFDRLERRDHRLHATTNTPPL
jgi:phytoene synthase